MRDYIGLASIDQFQLVQERSNHLHDPPLLRIKRTRLTQSNNPAMAASIVCSDVWHMSLVPGNHFTPILKELARIR